MAKKHYLDKDSSDQSLPMNRVAPKLDEAGGHWSSDKTYEEAPNSRWKDISTAPKDGNHVWLGTAKRVAVGYWYGRMGWIGVDCEVIPWMPTHWQEYFTPEPPIETRYDLPGHDETMAGLNSLTVRRDCKHAWKDVDSQSDNAVKCMKCSMAGERQRDGTVYWPAT